MACAARLSYQLSRAMAARAAIAPRETFAQSGCEQLEPSLEVAGVKDGAPYRTEAGWMVERTTTLLPFCNYFSPVGSYSLRSYSLDPFDRTERVTLCRGADPGASAPVAPYAGPCPPP